MNKEITLKNGSKLIIRDGNSSDAQAMLDYIHKISEESDFLTFGKGEFTKTLEEEAAFIENVSKQNNAIFIMAEIDGKIVANLSFMGGARPRTAHTGEFGISVLKEYWGLGIGKELMKYLIDWGRQSGVVRKINLRVRSDNQNAIHLYKSLGFIEEGIITRDLQIKNVFYDSISMGLSID